MVSSHKAFFEGTILESRNKGEHAEVSLQVHKNVNIFLVRALGDNIIILAFLPHSFEYLFQKRLLMRERFQLQHDRK